MNNERLSKVIDTMRLPLIFLVVIAHIAPFSYPLIKFSFSANHVFVLVSEMFSHHIAKFSVRCYFLVSGYYFFNKYAGSLIEFYRKQFKSRLKTIIQPYIIWNVLAILAVLSKNFIFLKLGASTDEDYANLLNGNLIKHFWLVPINFPLWYLRDLICMIFISPLIFYAIRYFKIYCLIAFGIFYLSCIDDPLPGFSSTALLFFSFGAYFSLEKKDLLQFFNKIKIPALIITLIFLFLSLKASGSDIHEYYLRVFIISGVITVFNLFAFLNDRLKSMNRLTGFSSLSFFIYIIHEIYIIEWIKGFFYNHHLFQTGWERFYAYLMIPCICMVLCCGLYYTLMKVVPKPFIFSLGGRIPKFNKYKEPDVVETLHIKTE